MKKSYNNLKNMYLAVQAVILRYIAAWTGYAPFETANTSFNGTVGDISDAEEAQKAIIKGFTVQKRNKKRTMAQLGFNLCKKVRAFAKATGNEGLFGEMSISFSKLFYIKGNLSIAYARNILEKVNTLTPAQKTAYNILDADVTAFTDSISAFEAINAMPRELIALRRTETQKFPVLFKKATDILRFEMDNLMSNYKVSNEEFYNDYFNARVIVNLIRHTAVVVNVTKPGGEDLKKVKVTLVGKDKITNEEKATFEELTDKDGNMIKRELNPELDWDVRFELPEFVPVQYSDLDLEAGKHLKLDVVMQPVNP